MGSRLRLRTQQMNQKKRAKHFRFEEEEDQLGSEQWQQHTTHRGPGIKQWRLIVRNLSFNTKEKDIHEWADKFGKIREIVLPKCKDKRFPDSCAGFCFIQFSRQKDAEKAKAELNFTEINGRKVAVDWAMDKDSYVTQSQKAKEMEQKSEIKTEEEQEEVNTSSAKEEIEKTNTELEVKTEPESEEEEEEQKAEVTPQKEKKTRDLKKIKRDRTEDDAVSQGRVVFLRNIPFSADDEKIKEVAEKFGQISLAILCKHRETGEPTGTGFVHFREKNGADAFLEQLITEEGVVLEGRQIFGHRAVQRNEAKAFVPAEKKGAKDKRNLYLLRASLIRPGTAQARGMSEADAKMRERLMETARSKLKSMVMFVSPTRLALHNIPFSFTDAQLKDACLQFAGCSPSQITECRIMRQRQGEDAKGRAELGKSKGFGFVAFAEHTAALNCLRKMNNDPNIFTEERRPIVEFSIENLNALRAKERRQAGQDDKNSQKKKEKSATEEEVEKTKRELMAGGKKWLPKKLGAKVRHRNSKKKAKGAGGGGGGGMKSSKRKRQSRATNGAMKRKRMSGSGMNVETGGKRRRKST